MPLSAFSDISKSLSFKQLSVICLSNASSFFDFLIYLYLADVISTTFFPISHDIILIKLQALSLFTVGYLARPIGGFVIGRYGDKHGRKPALLISLSFIAITTLITACLPTYQQVGIFAPILFIIARLFQGMAFGAHTPLGWVYVAEHVEKRNIATYCCIVGSSFIVGCLFALIFFSFLTTTYTHAQLVEYGWRVPFIVGAMLSFISLFLWHLLDETPVFLNRHLYKYEKQQQQHDKNHSLHHISKTLRRFNAIFIASLLTFMISSLTIVIALILPELIRLKFSIDDSMLNFAHGLGLFFIVIGCIFYGLLADKSSVGKSLMTGAFALIIQILAFYYHLSSGEGTYILVMYAILGFCTGIIGLGSVISVQLFPTEIRLTAVSIIYNVVYALVGGFLPIGLAYATNIISFSPALYIIFVCMVTFIVGLYVYRLPRFRNLNCSIKP